MFAAVLAGQVLPCDLATYPNPGSDSIVQLLWQRVELEPFNAIATAIFVLAIVAHVCSRSIHERGHASSTTPTRVRRARARRQRPSVRRGALHFFGEVEVVFGLWAVVLLVAMIGYAGGNRPGTTSTGRSTTPSPCSWSSSWRWRRRGRSSDFAEHALRRVANVGRGTPAAWWVSILTVGPLLGSFITEPAAMTICAMLLGAAVLRSASRAAAQVRDARAAVRQRLDRRHVDAFCRAAGAHGGADLGVGYCRSCWRTSAGEPCWRSWFRRCLLRVFRREFVSLTAVRRSPEVERAGRARPPRAEGRVAGSSVAHGLHMAFMAWTVFTAHYPALFLGGFLFFLGLRESDGGVSEPHRFADAAARRLLSGRPRHPWRPSGLVDRTDPREPVETPLFLGATVLTAFNDNALITYLATLVPDLDET